MFHETQTYGDDGVAYSRPFVPVGATVGFDELVIEAVCSVDFGEDGARHL